MARKIGITRGEMLELRKQGLSNADIANVLEISKATVFRYIGGQGCHMESMAAFSEAKPKEVETPKQEAKPSPKAVDSLEMVYEIVKSSDGSFRAEVDYESKCVSVLDYTIAFDQLGELATFIIGLVGRVEDRKGGAE